jgi:hypothetical protein
MSAAPYNTWYDATYDAILGMADWSRLDADVGRKIVCVYSWMPQTIMGIKHKGGRPKWASFSIADVQNTLSTASRPFSTLRTLELIATDIDKIETRLRRVLALTFPPLGSVVASKYLHFSAPKLIPMWDRAIRRARKHPDTPDGFISYMRQFHAELGVPKNLRAANAAYSANPIRGWDVLNMRGRDA